MQTLGGQDELGLKLRLSRIHRIPVLCVSFSFSIFIFLFFWRRCEFQEWLGTKEITLVPSM